MGVASAAPRSNREALERYVQAIQTQSFDELEAILDPEYTEVIPQSGEIVRGIENARAIGRAVVGLGNDAEISDTKLIESEPENLLLPSFSMTGAPAFSLVRIKEEGEAITAYARLTYPDGSVWYVVTLVTFRNHRLLQNTQFYAPGFKPPAWRAEWVELMPEESD